MSLGSDEFTRDASGTPEGARSDTAEMIAQLPEAQLPEVIALLEERLVVRSDKRMAGEIVLRKEIGTRMVEVPVRYERLIVEQVNPTYQQLAVIDLDQVNSDANAHAKTNATVNGVFDSPRAASDILDAIARTPMHGCESIRIEIVLKDAQHQAMYQAWFDRVNQTSNK